jgi:serine/threonine-protein kinase
MSSSVDELPGPASSPPDPMIGRVIAERYKVVQVLGEGGIAVVYRAEHLGLGRPVALKILHPVYGEHEELRSRFQREAKALAALSHPNIVNLVDYGVEDNMPYLVMELLQGRSLRDLLDEYHTLSPERAFSILKQVLRALAYAHAEGLIHRDLKPANVFLQSLHDTNDHVKILDFGFAKFVTGDQRDEGPALTRVGKVFGTPAYMAPEQVTGGAIDGRADLYSLGVLLFEMLSSQRPFEGEVPELIRAKVLGNAAKLEEVRTDVQVAPELQAFFDCALARQDDRFKTAHVMLEALDSIPQPALVPRTSITAPIPAPPPRRSTSPLLLLGLVAIPGVLAIALCAGGAFVLLGGGEEEPVQVSAPITPAEVIDDEMMIFESTGLPVGDPWEAAGDLPEVVASARAKVTEGEDLDQDDISGLRRHARAENDGRVWLLIGHAYTARGWRRDAITQYELAHGVDPALRGDPVMLANLIAMSAHGSTAQQASRAVRNIYGAEALPTVEAALRSPRLRPDGIAHLEALRRMLQS